MGYRDHLITTMEQLQALYGEKMPAAVIKEIDHINDSYREMRGVRAQPTTHAYNQISKATRHNATIIAALPQIHFTDGHHSMENFCS